MAQTEFHLTFFLLVAVLLWMVSRGILSERKIFEYPTFAAMMGLAWVVPQGIALQTTPNITYGSEMFWLYVALCFVFIALGFRVGKATGFRKIIRNTYQELTSFSNKRLLAAAAALLALGQFSAFRTRGIDTSGMGGEWTGIITMWALFSKANGLSLCLAVLIFARTKSPLAFIIAAIAAFPILQGAFLGVRRERLFDLVVYTAGAWYLTKMRSPSRLAVILIFFVGTVVLNTAGQLRGDVRGEQGNLVTALLSAETYTRFNFFELRSAHELNQASFDFWRANQTLDFELGASYYNSIINQYVPAFILGQDFKAALMISTLDRRIRRGEEEGAFSRGATRTGFSDSYRNFGPFGIFVFFLISYFFGRLFSYTQFGIISSQFLYLILIAEGLKAITHSTGEFVRGLPFILIIYFIVIYFSRRRYKESEMISPPESNSRFMVRD